jgi:hypothetical protein
MRIDRSIRQLITACCSSMHEKRRRTVTEAVTALLKCGCVMAAALGRALAVNTSDKHGIKRIDRLLGNARLHTELLDGYRALAAFTVGSTRHPVVLVDWTELGRDKCALKAVVAFHGRGLPLYSECHSVDVQARHSVHKRFLSRLARVLPEGCIPVLVTDAGFKQPWRDAVRARGWHFVSRVRSPTLVRGSGQDQWRVVRDCSSRFGRGITDLPHGELNRCNPVQVRLVFCDERSARARKPPRLQGRGIRTQRAVRGAHEPWMLATSMASCSAKEVASIYALRMQVEESIRDDKSHIFGWGFNYAKSRTCRRVDVQLFLVAIATIAAMLAGIATELAGRARHFQANTERRRRVLSLVTLGRRVLALDQRSWLTPDLLLGALWWQRQHTPHLLDIACNL